jgi:hypothetical protein
MTITFENNNNGIVYGLENIVSYTRSNQYIFLAQSIWWKSSIIGLPQGWIIHIVNLMARANISKQEFSSTSQDNPQPVGGITHTEFWHAENASRIRRDSETDTDHEGTSLSRSDTSEDRIQNPILDYCKLFLRQSVHER